MTAQEDNKLKPDAQQTQHEYTPTAEEANMRELLEHLLGDNNNNTPKI